VESLIAEAERRIEVFQHAQLIPAFVPSDHRKVFYALRYLKETNATPGNLFCEWGSGFGVATCLAALAGFQATGIEIEEPLVKEARELADSFEIEAEFLCDSFIPQGSEGYLDQFEASAWLTSQAGCVEEEYGLSPASFDLIFVYPWPGEEASMEVLFDEHASTGALLLSFHGREALRLKRKVASQRGSSGRRGKRIR
jgi:hypothetical protein